MLALMERVFETGSELDRAGIVLACEHNPAARELFAHRPDLLLKAMRGEIDWPSLAQQYVP
jgi:hypothetical protein